MISKLEIKQFALIHCQKPSCLAYIFSCACLAAALVGSLSPTIAYTTFFGEAFFGEAFLGEGALFLGDFDFLEADRFEF